MEEGGKTLPISNCSILVGVVNWCVLLNPFLCFSFKLGKSFQVLDTGWELVETTSCSPPKAVLGQIQLRTTSLFDIPAASLAGIVLVVYWEHAVQGLGLLGLQHIVD